MCEGCNDDEKTPINRAFCAQYDRVNELKFEIEEAQAQLVEVVLDLEAECLSLELLRAQLPDGHSQKK